MSSTRKGSNKWLLVQWGSGCRSVVDLKSVISPTYGSNVVGTVVVADKGDGTHEAATVICSARDREVLERQISPKATVNDDDDAGPSKLEDDEDFSASGGSSWSPSDEQASSDEEIAKKKIKLEPKITYKRSGRVIKPSHRADAINHIIMSRKQVMNDIRNVDTPNKMENKSHIRHGETPNEMEIQSHITNGDTTNEVEKKSHTRNRESPNEMEKLSQIRNGDTPNEMDKKSRPSLNRKSNVISPKSDIVSINVKDIMEMKQHFHELFRLLKEIKTQAMVPNLENENTVSNEKLNEQYGQNPMIPFNEYQSYGSDRSRSEEWNRSDDNVLITNKFDYAEQRNQGQKDNKIKVLGEKHQNQTGNNEDDWVAIGTGNTLIHKSVFRKVKWKSYTVATRSLLLAVFPRRILATHSLTGKKSPAFMNKPPKMCLDPKIVHDVVVEITERFGVKENLVRSIITTKCADECKMWKTRQQRKSVSVKNELNMTADNDDDVNMTC